MTTPSVIETIRDRDAIEHHPDRVSKSGKVHVIGDYLGNVFVAIGNNEYEGATLSDALSAAVSAIEKKGGE